MEEYVFKHKPELPAGHAERGRRRELRFLRHDKPLLEIWFTE